MLTIQNGGASNTTSATNSSSSGVVSNSQRQDFLNLLLAQLTQQTPLEPMDNEKLMSQIIGIETLDRLEGLIKSPWSDTAVVVETDFAVRPLLQWVVNGIRV